MKKMLINVASPEESRVAIVESSGRGRRHDLMEIYVERARKETILRNIYKGKVIRVEPSIQAAFVDCGVSQNGFLHVSDVMPIYGRQNGDGDHDDEGGGGGGGGRRRDGGARRRRIQDLLQDGQEVLVRVSKEAIGEKGPTLTTYLAIPGRGVVLMPSLTDRIRVSSKIESQSRRGRLRQMIQNLEPPKGMGYIVRTAAEQMTPEELGGEMRYLFDLWTRVCKRTKVDRSPSLIYAESDLVIRALRDTYTHDIGEVVLDDQQAYERAKGFFSIVSPRWVDRIKLHDDALEPLFIKYQIENQVDGVYDHQVPLPSGGSIVMEQTEALVAIDVNSGRFTKEDDIEETALQTNLEAVREVARQLRLRDLGGVIVLDLIDMKSIDNRRKVENEFRGLLDNDRARTKMSRISQFGIVEMTRQRVGESLRRYTHELCPTCAGAGWVRNPATMSLLCMRRIHQGLRDKRITKIEIIGHPSLLDSFKDERMTEIEELQSRTGKSVTLTADAKLALSKIDVKYVGDNGHKVTLR